MNTSGVGFARRAIFDRHAASLDDDLVITVADEGSDPGESRFVTIGLGANGRVLVVVYCYRDQDIRIISARPADPGEREEYEGQP